MSITGLNFYFALVIVLAVYWVAPRRFQNYWLLLISYAFHLTWGWQFGLILLTLTALNYFLAIGIERQNQRQPGLLWAGIALNVAALVLFRVANFFVPGLVSLLKSLGIPPSQPFLEIIVPIGLSYYTLQNISYLIDVYRKQNSASRNFIDFALYLAYFPKILSGPIERARPFLAQLGQPRRADNQLLTRGFILIVTGLLRKLLAAGFLSGIIFWDAFEIPSKYTGPELIGWVAIYALFLYNDFAGYTNIARGISSLFGIELSLNFKQPFFARSLTEFWNSWHISLSHWLRDYIFYPARRALLKLNRSPYHPFNLVLPPLVTMLVSGLWHGLGWQMLLWGGTHGLLLTGENLISLRWPALLSRVQPLWRHFLSAVMVFILLIFTWVPFIMEPSLALSYWRGMVDWTYPTIRFRRMLLYIPVLILILLLDWLESRFQDETFYTRLPEWAQAILLGGALFLLWILMDSRRQNPFVYQEF